MFYLQEKLTQEKIQSEIERFVFEAMNIDGSSQVLHFCSFMMDKGWKDFYEEEKEERRDLKEFMLWHGNSGGEIQLQIVRSKQISSVFQLRVDFLYVSKDIEVTKKLVRFGWKLGEIGFEHRLHLEEVYEKNNVSEFIYNSMNMFNDYEWIIYKYKTTNTDNQETAYDPL